MKYKLIILDRDGVINKKADSGSYITSWKDFKFLPKAREAISSLTKKGYILAIASNQRGIAKKSLTLFELEKIHKNMLKEIEDFGGKIEKVYFCPHDYDEKCNCRKPSPGMIIQAMKEFNISAEETLILGDSFSDYQAANNAKCDFIHICTFSDEQVKQRALFSSLLSPPLSFNDLFDVSRYLEEK